ncbi:Type I Iterative PKS [Metarhizium acridum]|nr:Type I Iterative PKS [Metarhizium acridum]
MASIGAQPSREPVAIIGLSYKSARDTRSPTNLDTHFFDFPPELAASLSSLVRLELESAYEATENARRNNGHEDSVNHNGQTLSKPVNTSTDSAVAAARISHFFDFRGPSITLNTTTSLVALHQAVQSLQSGESSMAVVEDSNLTLSRDIPMCQVCSSVLCPIDKSSALEAGANEDDCSERVATLVIKLLKDALLSGDPIRAVIRETLVNQDGKTEAITTPQAILTRHCYHTAAVKTGATTGLSGIIKVVLAMEKALVPPSPVMPLKTDSTRVGNEAKEWPLGPDDVQRVSINSFGAGFADAHFILEDAESVLPRIDPPAPTQKPTQKYKTKVLVLSAGNEGASKMITLNLKNYLEKRKGTVVNEEALLENLLYTLGQRRTLFEWVAACRVPFSRGIDEVIKGLEALKFKPKRCRPRIGMVFTGQGAQWHAMGREAIIAYPPFKASLEEGDVYLKQLGADWSLLEELHRDGDTTRVNDAAVSIPICAALQISLVRLLRSWGVRPTAVASHSSGDIAAAYTVGALNYQSALAVAYYRAVLTSNESHGPGSPKGCMIAIGAGIDQVESYLRRLENGRAVAACVNSPLSVTVAGDASAVEEVEAMAKADGLFARRLRVDTAYHSHHMDPIAQPYQEALSEHGIKIAEGGDLLGSVSFSSAVTGGRIHRVDELATPEYWVKSLTNPVRFIEAISDMVLGDFDPSGTSVDLIIEIGPHSALRPLITEILRLPEFNGIQIPYYSCLFRNTNARDSLQDLVASLLCEGYSISLEPINFPWGKWPHLRVLTDLPTYPWSRQIRHEEESSVNKAINILSLNDDEANEPAVKMEGLVPQSVDADPVSPGQPQFKPWERDICNKIKWAPDMTLSTTQALQSLKRQLDGFFDPMKDQIAIDLRRVCIDFMQNALAALTEVDVKRLNEHHRKYYTWMQTQVQLARDGNSGPKSSQRPFDNDLDYQRRIAEAAKASVIVRMVCQLGPRLADFLRRSETPPELMLEDEPLKLLYKSYNNIYKSDSFFQHLVDLLQRIVHKNHRARIIEIGGGTGSKARHWLNAMRATKHGFPMALLYHFTDISIDHLEAAKPRFAEWSGIVHYSVFDMEKDPADQGLDTGTYDIVIMFPDYHGTKSKVKTISNVRKLLKPGGSLLFVEMTRHRIDLPFVLGLLPDWRHSEEELRPSNQSLSVTSWNTVLQSSGFTGVDLELHDRESEGMYSIRTIMSTAVPDSQPEGPSLKEVLLVTSSKTPVPRNWLTSLQRSMGTMGSTDGPIPAVKELETSCPSSFAGKICVFFGEMVQPILAPLETAQLGGIKSMSTSCKGLLWITRGGAVDCEQPDRGLAVGFIRSLRNKYVGRKFCTLDLDPKIPVWCERTVPLILQILHREFAGNNVTSAFLAPSEFEYAERNGTFLIPRLQKSLDENKFIVPEAVNYSTTDRISGDKVLQMDNPARRQRTTLSPDASYLIVGGVGGIGRSVVRWMVDRGAKNLILLSRSAGDGIKTGGFVEEAMQEMCCRIKAISGDVSDAANLALALQECRQDRLPPIRGIVHAAMVVQASLLAKMTINEYKTVIMPKVNGTWNLHSQFPHIGDLDFFVILSSNAGTLGYASQANYAAACSYQDALAQCRVSRGLPCVSIDLPVVKSIGHLAERAELRSCLEKLGQMSLDQDMVCKLIELAILEPYAGHIVVGINAGPGPHWDPDGFSQLGRDARFFGLQHRQPRQQKGAGEGKEDDDDGRLPIQLAAASSQHEAERLVSQAIAQKLARILMISVSDVDMSRPPGVHGVDSMVAVDLGNLLRGQIAAEISSFDIMQSASLDALAVLAASRSAHVKS